MSAAQDTTPAVPETRSLEDQKRDEILCRMLNTPYRPHQAMGPGAPQAADPAAAGHIQD